mmetsp:Transcript_24688/g.30806  ORF Transcript_24688/g.30806 Transcript_24688/m.30806 type:complete len:138 (-) Transcript_24688:406-819(-)
MVIIVLKVLEMCCCGFDDSPTTAGLNTCYYMLVCLFITATVDGFLHDDISFATKTVTKPWKQPQRNGVVQPDQETKEIVVEQAESPMSMILALCTASGSLYILCMFLGFLAPRCRRWWRDCLHIPEPHVTDEEQVQR